MSVAPEITPLNKIYSAAIAGGSAGLLELLTLHPLDVVSTRLQLQGAKDVPGEAYYNGVFDCFAKIYRQEGLPALWKGILPPILSEPPKRAAKFVLFEVLKPLFLFGDSHPTTLTYALAGSLAGTLECFAVNPFEVVKITQQADRRNTHSALRVSKNVIKHGGFGRKGLYKGLTAFMLRNAVFHFVYFGIYFGAKDLVPAPQDPVGDFLRKGSLAFLSGILGSMLSTPFDVTKARIQGPQPEPHKIKYKWPLKTMLTIYREEGALALYKGLSAKLLRVGPGGAMLLLGYEYTYEYLLLLYS